MTKYFILKNNPSLANHFFSVMAKVCGEYTLLNFISLCEFDDCNDLGT